MPVEGTIKRIGGSTFVRLPPDVVKRQHLHDGDKVLIEVRKQGGTVQDLDQIIGTCPGIGPFGREERLHMWDESET